MLFDIQLLIKCDHCEANCAVLGKFRLLLTEAEKFSSVESVRKDIDSTCNESEKWTIVKIA